MIDDSDPPLVAADRQHEALARDLAGGLGEVVILESLGAARSVADLLPGIGPDRLAYLVYTSGSTGRPKAILHSHRTALHNIDNYTRFLRLCPEDRLSWLHSMSFSSGLLDVLSSLLNGVSLVPWDSRSRGLAGLPEWVEQAGIDRLQLGPTPFRQLAESMRGSDGLTTPRTSSCWGAKRRLAAIGSSFDAICPTIASWLINWGRRGQQLPHGLLGEIEPPDRGHPAWRLSGAGQGRDHRRRLGLPRRDRRAWPDCCPQPLLLARLLATS